MAEGKWIPGLTPTTPVDEAARKTLVVRFKVIADYLPLALKFPTKDPEFVHQLRVGTRRAGAALAIFASCFERKDYRKARRLLKHLRRAAGSARDWDVFLLMLAKRACQPGSIDFLLGYGRGQRDAAQVELDLAGAEYPHGFAVFAERIVSKLHSPGADEPQMLADLARPALAALAAELHEAATQDLSDYEHLHSVRILGKRLRYAMEVFAPCYGEHFRDKLYPAVEEMQEILGRANDSHVARQRLETLRDGLRQAFPDEWQRIRPEVEKLLRFHQRRLPQERRRFVQWWKRWEAMEAVKEFSVRS